MYEIRFTKVAKRRLDQLAKGDKRDFRRIREALARLREDPRGPSTRQLEGQAPKRRLRVGARRVIYEVDDAKHLIVILDVQPRGQAYGKRTRR